MMTRTCEKCGGEMKCRYHHAAPDYAKSCLAGWWSSPCPGGAGEHLYWACPRCCYAMTTETMDQRKFFVMLTGYGEQRIDAINAIKVVREVARVGLREAKDFVDRMPSRVLEGLSREDAESAVERLREYGVTAVAGSELVGNDRG